MTQPDETTEVKFMRGLLNRITALEDEIAKDRARDYVFQIDMERMLGTVQGAVILTAVLVILVTAKEFGFLRGFAGP